MELPRRENWSGLPFPFPGNLPNPGTEPTSPALAVGFFVDEPPRKSFTGYIYVKTSDSVHLNVGMSVIPQ